MSFLSKVARPLARSGRPLAGQAQSWGQQQRFVPTRSYHHGGWGPYPGGPMPPYAYGGYGMGHASPRQMMATTILSVRRGNQVIMIGDGQVSAGSNIVKHNAKKLRRLNDGNVLVGVAGATADALTLVARLEEFIRQHPDQLLRSCVELAKLWRTDRVARRLDASLLVADRHVTLEVNGAGDVIEPFDDVMGIGSGSVQAMCAARALIDIESVPLEEVAMKAMRIAAASCVYTNDHFMIERLTGEDPLANADSVLTNPIDAPLTPSQPLSAAADAESSDSD